MRTHGHVIGIDLGTTFSAMSYLERHGSPTTIVNAEGELITPSVILFETDGSVIVGREARRASLVFHDRVASCVKRDMGELFYSRPVAGRKMSPSVLAACILRKLKQDAEAKIGEVAGVVITVPAYFDEGRRQATVDAGTIAGLHVLDIINEPTSAALAYAFKNFMEHGGSVEDFGGLSPAPGASRKRRSRGRRIADMGLKPATVMVYDLGGGTFDVSIVRIEGGSLRVLATDGDVQLGGKDWDDRLVKHAAKLFADKFGMDPCEDPQAHQDLLLAAEDAKKQLSGRKTTRLTVNHGGHRLSVDMTREEFDAMTNDLLFRTQIRTALVVEQAGLNWQQIDQVLMVGGSTRMPQVPAMLKRLSGQKPNGSLSADEVVSHGAAIHGAILRVGGTSPGRWVQVGGSAAMDASGVPAAVDETPPPPSDRLAGIVDDAVPMPNLNEDISPADALASMARAGAAGRSPAPMESPPEPGATFKPNSSVFNESSFFDQDVTALLQEVVTVNVNAHSLGVVARSDMQNKFCASVLIPRNSPLPASRKRTYGTIIANQQRVRVEVLEGESPDPAACIAIGECVVDPLPPNLPKGSPISVTFTYDNSGRLHVRARDETSGLTAKCMFVRTSTLDTASVTRAKNALEQVPIT